MESNTLSHYGILGMRWGVRRTPAQLSRARGKIKSENEVEKDDIETIKAKSRKSAELLYKNRDMFTDKELNEAYLRLNTEQNIKNLIPKKVSAGKKFVDAYVNTSKTVKSVADGTDAFVQSYSKFVKLMEKSSQNKNKG